MATVFVTLLLKFRYCFCYLNLCKLILTLLYKNINKAVDHVAKVGRSFTLKVPACCFFSVIQIFVSAIKEWLYALKWNIKTQLPDILILGVIFF